MFNPDFLHSVSVPGQQEQHTSKVKSNIFAAINPYFILKTVR